MHRFRFVLTRPLQLLPVLLGISIITFVLVRSIPGDPARVLLGTKSSPEALARIRAQFGLDEPLWVQYLYFLKNLTDGELGTSILYRTSVFKLIIERVEPTLFLVLGGVLLAIAMTVPLASIAARNRGGTLDHVIRFFSTVGLGLPAFWLGIMLIIFLSVRFDLFPVSGYGENLPEKLHHLVLPCLTVALSLSAVLTRTLRASLIDEASSDYATAARARGLPEKLVFRRHVLPNSVVPSINLLAINISWIIGSSVVVETVFALPGLGQLLVRGIFTRDYMVVQGVAMIFAFASVTINFLADILTVAADPRVKL